jgi:hypothetical protein
LKGRVGERARENTHDAVQFVIDAQRAERAGSVGQRERGLAQLRHLFGVDPEVDV